MRHKGMDDKKQEDKQQPIVVYGMANIGCDQTGATFQTLVASHEGPTSEEAVVVEEEGEKPKATNERKRGQARPKVKTANNAGRPKKSGTRIRKAFIYDNKVDGSVRLRTLCQGLVALGWLAAETDMQVFVDLFSGGETQQRLIWKGDANTLAELFKRLVNERGLVTLPDKHSLWVMVSGHFWDKNRGQEFESTKLRNTHAPKENDQTIAYLVSILDPEVPMDKVREMMQNQR